MMKSAKDPIELYYGKENLMNNQKEKSKRYHVELSVEQGEVFSMIADRMDLTLSTVVKLMLVENWLKYRSGGKVVLSMGVVEKE